MAKTMTRSNIFNGKLKMKVQKFVSTDISVLIPDMLYLQCQLKSGVELNIKTLIHCENLLKVSKEIKQYIKMRLLNLINNIEQNFPRGTAVK